MKVSEVKQLEDKDIITEVSGTLTRVFEIRKGRSGERDWSIQGAELADETGTIRLMLSNRPELPQDKEGEEVILRCFKGDKGKSGLYVHENTYQGVTSKQLKVTATGRFIWKNGSEAPRIVEGQKMSPENKNPLQGILEQKKGILGVTAGCATKLAVDVLLGSCESKGLLYYKSPEFAEDVFRIASGLLPVMQKLEAGELWQAPAVPSGPEDPLYKAMEKTMEDWDILEESIKNEENA